MKIRIKELIIKTVIIVGAGLLIAIFPGSILISFFIPDQETFMTIFKVVLISFFADGILLMALMPFFANKKSKKKKPIKKSLLFDSFNDLMAFLNGALKKNGFLKMISENQNKFFISIYTASHGLWEKDLFVVIQTHELSEEIFEKANDKITNELMEHYGELISDKINVISLFCVDKNSPFFKKIISEGVMQGFKNGRFIAGFSFFEKELYIAQPNDDFLKGNYKKLHKKFEQIITV